MNDINLFLKRAIRLVVLLPFIWFGFIIVWGTVVPEKFRKNLAYAKAPGFTDLRLREADSMKNIDVLIVGSSHVYRGIDPRRFESLGLKTFNLGSSLQSPVQTEYLLRRYLDQFNPKLVFFEVGYKTFSSDGIEGALDIIINSEGFDYEILRMAGEVNDIRVFNSLAYTFFRKKILGETRLEYLANHADEYVSGGFVERVDSTYVGPESFYTKAIRLEENQQRSFEKSLDFLTSRGIKTILIQTPILQDYYRSIENMHDFNDYFKSLSDNFEFYNFNDKIYQHTKYFYDHHHLNSNGVERFNDDLIEAIKPHLQGIKSKENNLTSRSQPD